MLVLDTNVVSELMRPKPDPRVLEWVDLVPLTELAITTITIMEIRFGLLILSPGRRQSELEGRFRQFLELGFDQRILDFDERAATLCASIRALRRRIGKPMASEDSMIAAVAGSHGATIVSRDAGGFAGCGVPTVNPWI